MSIRRIVIWVMCPWMAVMIFHRPLGRLIGRDWVEHIVDAGFCLLMLLLAVVFWVHARQSRKEMVRVMAPATISGAPVRLAMDTGAFTTMLLRQTANRLGMKFKRVRQLRVNFARGLMSLTDQPATLVVCGQTITAPVPVLGRASTRFLLRFGKVEGFLGWPAIRKNILEFDGVARVVRALDAIPPEASEWMKFEIEPAPQLILRIPISDGQNGSLLIDTGDPFGGGLPRSQWRQWRKGHRTAPRSHRYMAVPGTLSLGGSEQIWADALSFGCLTLTDLPARQASGLQGRVRERPLGSLGLYALTRMDLIVDGIGGFAYVQPKPPPGPAFAGISRPEIPDVPKDAAEAEHWMLADNVRIDGDHLLAFELYCRGAAAKKQQDYPRALADLNRCLELDPIHIGALVARGSVKKKAGDLEGAIADFTQAIDLAPGSMAAYLLRALARHEIHDDAGAIDDCTRAGECRMPGLSGWQARLLARILRSYYRSCKARAEAK